MSKNYNKLWVIGDSFTTPGVCVNPQDSFWGLLGTRAQIPIINNCSRIVNSFDSVCQLLIGMQQEYDWQKDLFIIGVPPLKRITVFDDHKNTRYTAETVDTQTWKSVPFDVKCHTGLISLQNFGEDKTLIIHDDTSWTETQALRTIFLLTSWLDAKNANYLILSLSKEFDKDDCWLPNEFVLKYCKTHPRCILFDDTYYKINLNINPPADFDQYGWFGHHGPVGNRYFFEKSLWPRLQQCGLI